MFEIGVKLFLLIRGLTLGSFFYLEIIKKNKYDLGKIFDLGLILGFKTIF
jgi:hypothetical protein